MSLVRDATLLPWRWPAPAGEELALSDILLAARAAEGRPGAFLIGGGEPLRRHDLWELLAGLAGLRPARLGLCTSGHGLTPALAEHLRAAAVQRVHIPFHSARQDAHDWLVGHPGALKIAHRALRACSAAGLPVVAEVVLTRPTMTHLPETVEVLSRLGVRAVCVRRLTAMDTVGAEFVPLSPRLSLLESSLEHAAALAVKRRVRLTLRDLPLCAAPRLRPLFGATAAEVWVMRDGGVRARSDGGVGCSTCPGPPLCAGAPPDYAARFGWEEFVDPRAASVRVAENVTEQLNPRSTTAMVFTWNGPRRVRCEACADAASRDRNEPYASTRVVRARLVEAARERPALLRVVGADLLAHPQAALLLFDAVRLFENVEVAGEASALVDWSDLDLRRLKELRRIDVALYGPDASSHDAHCGIPGAFAAMQRGLERVRSQSDIPIGAYAVLHDARLVGAFAEAWDRGGLPGEPRFRLSGRGASLDELAAAAAALPSGAARAALSALLPNCVRGEVARPPAAMVDAIEGERRIECGRSIPHQPGGSDPIGAFDACENALCRASGCRGTAVGWHSTARSQRWMANP